MEGPKTIGNISQKDNVPVIKFETDCATESVEPSAQYVSDKRPALTGRTACAQNLLDNNGVIFKQNREPINTDSKTTDTFTESLFSNGLGNKTNKIKQIIEPAISPESKATISKILDQINQLSIAEKLLLYLKLPTGRSQTIDPLRQPLNPLGSRFEIHQTITWIKTHLEEDQDTSLPKQDVYDEYLSYCDRIAMKPLSTADFGKVMKQVFPRVRPRRLGTRGNSRYCYAGMRKRSHLDAPLLPELEETNYNHCAEDETFSAASCLIREWAEKLLSVKFNSLQELACHLVENMCVDSRSMAAFTLLSSLEPRKYCSEKDVIPLLLPSGAQASKHREAQLQLQRKLQEREVIREQKRKMQDHQSSSHRTHMADKPRVKRSKLSHQVSVENTNSSVPKQPEMQCTNLIQENFSQDNKTAPQLPPPSLSHNWQSSNCDIRTTDISTKKRFVSNKPCKSNQSESNSSSAGNCNNQVSDEFSALNCDVPDLTQVGFNQCLQLPSLANDSAKEGSELNKVGNRSQCQNKTEMSTFYEVPNKRNRHPKFSNRSPVTNTKSRHLSLDFEPNLSHTKMSGRNSAMGHFDYDIKHTKSDILKSDKTKSCLSFYLENQSLKRARKVPPVQDLSKEFESSNLFKNSPSPNLSPNIVQKQLPGLTAIASHSSDSLPTSPPHAAKLPIPRLANPNKKLPTPATNLIIIPSVPIIQKSQRKKYKLIQPKVDSPTEKEDVELSIQKMGKEGSAFVSPKLLSKNVPKDKFECSKLHSPNKSKPSLSDGSTSFSNLLSKVNGNHQVSYGVNSLHSNMPLSPPAIENINNLAPLVSNPLDVHSLESANKLPIVSGITTRRVRNEVSIGCLEKDALDDYLHGGGNSQEQEEELMQYFQEESSPGNSDTHVETPETQAKLVPDKTSNGSDKLSQLRQLLERNLTSVPSRSNVPSPTFISTSSSLSTESSEYIPSSTGRSASHSLSMMSQRSQLQTRLNKSNLVLPSLLLGGGYSNSGLTTRRRVSFETSVIDNPENSVPPSPNTRRRTFNFTPINAGPNSPQGRLPSKPSSANASPFISPRNTPVPRSKQNLGQVSTPSSFIANLQNRAQTSNQMLNAGVNTTYPANDPQCMLSQSSGVGQRNQSQGIYPGQKSTSSSHSSTLGNSVTNTVNQLVAASTFTQGTSNVNISNSENTQANSVDCRDRSRQSVKLQRSQSVNSNSALQYLLQTNKTETFNQPNSNKNDQALLESKVFAIPGELNNSGNIAKTSTNSYQRGSTMSLSAPQSPIVHYHAKLNPFDFKMRDNSAAQSTLLENMLKRDSTQGYPSDQYRVIENAIPNLKRLGCNMVDSEIQNSSVLMANPLESVQEDKEEMEDSNLVIDEPSLGVMNLDAAVQLQKVDTLSQEVSQFFPEDGSDGVFQKNIPNFAQLQYRSQSVPLRRMSALVSPLYPQNCLNFSNFSNANSTAPTPVPSEYQDFGTDMLLDNETTVQEGLNTDNLNHIFNLLSAQEENQAQMNLESNDAKSQSHSDQTEGNDGALNIGSNDILMMEQNLGLQNEGNFDQSLMPENIKLESLPPDYQTTLTISLNNNNSQELIKNENLPTQPNFELTESEVCNLGMKEEFQEDLTIDFNQTTQQFEDGMSMDTNLTESSIHSRSYPNTPLPYTSTVEYVTDAPLGSFPLSALNLHSVQARLTDHNSFELRQNNSYLRDELMTVSLSLAGATDTVSQLEQEVNKL